jgi:hypothetical protein
VSFDHYEPCPRCREIGRDNRGDNLAIYRDGSMHCYACHYHVFPKNWWRYAKEVEDDHGRQDKAVLPSDFSREVPARCWQWLLKFGLGYRYWQSYCGYSEKDQRLVFTVGDPVAFSVGRYIPVSGAPEPERQPRKWHCYGDAHQQAHVIGSYLPSESVTPKVVVLVEDLISAHKVGQACPCIPLFGTHVYDAVTSTLRHIGLPVLLWLDKDQEGRVQKQALKLSIAINQPVQYIFTEKDPKELPMETITRIVNEH